MDGTEAMDEVKQYLVTANKSSYFSQSFATTEEAMEAVGRLIHEGYTFVSVRDNHGDGDIW